MKPIDPGKFKDLVQILERKVEQEETLGTDQVTWPVKTIVSAEVVDVLPSRSEQVGEGIALSRQPARIRMRYRTDVTSDMRLMVRGRMMQIVAGPAVLGNRQYLELMAEAVSTLGDAA